MLYFKDGLSREELDKEYKRLARIYHPDMNRDRNTTEEMQAINEEYDKYFTDLRYKEIGYNYGDVRRTYEEAASRRNIILAFMRRDKNSNSKNHFFGFNDKGRIDSDDSESWNDFHGGFTLGTIDDSDWHGFSNQDISRIDGKIEFPSYEEMYFHQQFGGIQTTDIQVVNNDITQSAYVYEAEDFTHISSKNYGDMWVINSQVMNKEYINIWGEPRIGWRKIKVAFMKANNLIMSCQIPEKIGDYEVLETINGLDFGFIAFQDCTRSEFIQYHDTELAEWHYALKFNPMFKNSWWSGFEVSRYNDLYWIDDPVVIFYAKRGIVKFYQSEKNFTLKYGIFDMNRVQKNLHLMSIDDVEHVQDFLDQLRNQVDTRVKGMIKKGKLKVNI